MARKVHQFIARFDVRLWARLREASARRRMSINQSVNQAVERWVEDE